MNLGLYIHIPFCRRKCPYCNFYSVTYQHGLADDYLAILTEIIAEINDNIDTVYIGGGNPSVFQPQQLEHLLVSLGPITNRAVEVSLEANPETLTLDKIKILAQTGVNRLSLGAQSFDSDKLRFLGRRHRPGQIAKLIEQMQRQGLDNINLDLIYGLPQEDIKHWQQELRIATSLEVKHISAYILSCEAATPFSIFADKINEQLVADMYRFTLDYLPAAGFRHYEVSNFALQHYRCRHNLKYWQAKQYLGLGPAAASFYKNERYQFKDSIADYIKYRGSTAAIAYREKLTPLARAREAAALMIRLREGINLEKFQQQTKFNLWQVINRHQLDKLVKQGLVEYKYNELNKVVAACLTKEGFIFADSVSSSMI
jgi:oxygen-independent coproporphyrinogen-3 oxidase